MTLRRITISDLDLYLRKFFPFFFFTQVYPQQGETFQMQRMRKRILSEQDSGGAQDSPYGGIAAQMSRMLQEFQSKEQSEDTPPYAHRRAAGFKDGSTGRSGIQDQCFHYRQTDGGEGEWTDPDSEDQHHHP